MGQLQEHPTNPEGQWVFLTTTPAMRIPAVVLTSSEGIEYGTSSGGFQTAVRSATVVYASAVVVGTPEADLGTPVTTGNASRLIAQITATTTGTPSGATGSVVLQSAIDGTPHWFDVAVFGIAGSNGNATTYGVITADVPLGTAILAPSALSRGTTASQAMPLGNQFRFTGVNSLTGGTPVLTVTVTYQLVV